MVGGIIPLRRATSSRYDGRLGQESAAYLAETLTAIIDGLSWSRLSEQNLRVDKWSLCRV